MSRPGRAAAALLPFLALLSAACARRPEGVVVPGSRVTAHYALSVDGKEVDTSEGPGREAVAFTQGRGQVIPGLDAGVLGMREGEERRLTLPPERAYGRPDPSAVEEIPLEALAGIGPLKPGMTVHGARGGKAASGRVVRLGPKNAVLDFNHPLAGKTLDLRVRVLSVR